MNRPSSFDPLSITHRVQTKLDQKTSKVSVPDVSLNQIPHAQPSHSKQPAMTSTHDLKDQFLSLLLASTEQAIQHGQVAPEKFLGPSETHGTSPCFLQPNKQENTNNRLEKNQIPFQFAIQNSALGELQIKGHWQQGQLYLSIGITKALDPKERRLLSYLLKIRLSKELDIALEVSVD